MKVTEEAKTPFRLFGTIEYTERKCPEAWGNVSMSIRPLRTTERAIWDNEKAVFEGSKVTFSEALEKSGYTKEDVFIYNEDKTPKVDEDGLPFVHVSAFKKVLGLQTVNASDLERYESAKRDVVLKCVSSVTIDGLTDAMTAVRYDSIESQNVVDWMIDQIEYDSYIQKDEVVGL